MSTAVLFVFPTNAINATPITLIIILLQKSSHLQINKFDANIADIHLT